MTTMLRQFSKLLSVALLLGLLLHPLSHLADHHSDEPSSPAIECALCVCATPVSPEVALPPVAVAVTGYCLLPIERVDAVAKPAARGRAPPAAVLG